MVRAGRYRRLRWGERESGGSEGWERGEREGQREGRSGGVSAGVWVSRNSQIVTLTTVQIDRKLLTGMRPNSEHQPLHTIP